MPKDIPRLQWFGGGGDTRSPSSVWLGFAQLLMPKEYDRVEAIRRHRREVKLKRKAEVEADAEAAAAETVTAQQVIAYAGDAEGNKAGEAAADRSAVGEVEGEGGTTTARRGAGTGAGAEPEPEPAPEPNEAAMAPNTGVGPAGACT